jgi:hypothetical protein
MYAYARRALKGKEGKLQGGQAEGKGQVDLHRTRR